MAVVTTFTTLVAKAGAIFRLRGLVLDALCLGLAGCEDWFKKEIPTPKNNWDELCAIKDCSQYPDGYLTVDADEKTYYFPLSTKSAFLSKGYISMKYIKRDPQDKLTVIKGYSDFKAGIDLNLAFVRMREVQLKDVGLSEV